MLEPKAVRRVEVITGNGSAAAVLQRRSFAPGRGFGGGAAAWADAIATVAPTGGGADECQDERRLLLRAVVETRVAGGEALRLKIYSANVSMVDPR